MDFNVDTFLKEIDDYECNLDKSSTDYDEEFN